MSNLARAYSPQPGTDLSDVLEVASKSSRLSYAQRELYRTVAKAVNQAASDAIALRFSQEAMIELNAWWTKGFKLLLTFPEELDV
jgi:hypothetical protein